MKMTQCPQTPITDLEIRQRKKQGILTFASIPWWLLLISITPWFALSSTFLRAWVNVFFVCVCEGEIATFSFHCFDLAFWNQKLDETQFKTQFKILIRKHGRRERKILYLLGVMNPVFGSLQMLYTGSRVGDIRWERSNKCLNVDISSEDNKK